MNRFLPLRLLDATILVLVLSMLVCAAASAQNAGAYLGGTKATGLVTAVYVKAGDSVFLAVNLVSARLQESAERWVEIELNGLPRGDIVTVRGAVDHDAAQVELGDVVEIKFANRNTRYYFPMKDETRVTRPVARKGETLPIETARATLTLEKRE